MNPLVGSHVLMSVIAEIHLILSTRRYFDEEYILEQMSYQKSYFLRYSRECFRENTNDCVFLYYQNMNALIKAKNVSYPTNDYCN